MSDALERAQEIRAVLDDVSGAAVASDTRVHLARAALDALDQALIAARSNIAGARAILWQEGDHDGTPLIVLAESRMAELARLGQERDELEAALAVERGHFGDEYARERVARLEQGVAEGWRTSLRDTALRRQLIRANAAEAALAVARKREQRAKKAMVEAAIPLEVLAGQIRTKPYRELTDELQAAIERAVLTIRAALVDEPAAATLAEPGDVAEAPNAHTAVASRGAAPSPGSASAAADEPGETP